MSQNPPAFKPVTIVLETIEEVAALLGAVGALQRDEHANNAGLSADSLEGQALGQTMYGLYHFLREAR